MGFSLATGPVADCTVNSTVMKFATGRTPMASISPSTLISTFRSARELQIARGPQRQTRNTQNPYLNEQPLPPLREARQAPSEDFTAGRTTCCYSRRSASAFPPPSEGRQAPSEDFTAGRTTCCDSRPSASAFPPPSEERQAPSGDSADTYLCPCPILCLPDTFPSKRKA